MKRFIQILVASLMLSCSSGAEDRPCPFTIATRAYDGTPVEQARCLLRPVLEGGHVGETSPLPSPLEELVGTPVRIPLSALRHLIGRLGISEAEIGGPLSDPLSSTNLAPVVPAQYFIIHDTSSCRDVKQFPDEDVLNDPSFSLNSMARRRTSRVAHLFINRAGESAGVGFIERIGTTKFDARLPRSKVIKGLMLGVELVQPRRPPPGKRCEQSDRIAPEPGFSDPQLERLALVYIAASIRAGQWMIPAFHAVVDVTIPGGHDDPQHFNLTAWVEHLDRLIKILDLEDLQTNPQLAPGGDHTCALLTSGRVKCWGANTLGQLGDGTLISKSAPSPFITLGRVTAVASGKSHSCALRATGDVLCWGSHGQGQLGIGDLPPTEPQLRVTPKPVNIPKATRIAAGFAHTCAATSGGAYCWGENSFGQLGNGTNQQSKTPSPIQGLSGPPDTIVAGQNHTCALVSGAVFCWGDNSKGQLGDPGLPFGSQTNIPRAVPNLGRVREIVAGKFHNCVLLETSRQAACWGDIAESGIPVPAPTVVTFFDNRGALEVPTVLQVAAGYFFSCAIIEEQPLTHTHLRCWGSGIEGRLGNGMPNFVGCPTSTGTGCSKSPTGLQDVLAVAAGETHACAFYPFGQTECWGGNLSGQLGDGSTLTKLGPVPIAFDWRQ